MRVILGWFLLRFFRPWQLWRRWILADRPRIGSGAGSAGIRPMKGKVTWVKASNPAELDQLVDWAPDEGWNPGLHDAALF